MKLRELFEAPGKTAVAAFGRLNPPTIGHAKLVDKIKSVPGDHFLFLSQTQNAKDNPLSFDQKIRFAKASFSDITIGNPTVRTPIEMMQQLEKLGYTDIVYIAGSDRASSFDQLLNKYNGKDYKFNSIKVVSAGERDPDADGAEGMSASKMRKAAIEGDFDSFKQGVANPQIATEMYDAIRDAMGIKNEIMAFGIKRGPKRTTIKKKPEKFEPSVQDKIAARRKAYAKGDKNAFTSDFKKDK